MANGAGVLLRTLGIGGAHKWAIPATMGLLLGLGCSGESADKGGTGGSVQQQGGSAGSAGGSAGSAGTAGSAAQSGGAGSAGSGTPSVGFGTPTQTGQSTSTDRYAKRDVSRNDVNYFFMANGWGPNFKSQTVSWHGTSFTVESMEGSRGMEYQPASYPTVFCGVYSDSKSKECGLPKALTGINSLRTGWRWAPNGNTGQYNAAYDIWLGNGTTIDTHAAYLMVWLRDPPGQQPAGSLKSRDLTVANTPGTWNVWSGTVGGKPCISYVRAEGNDSLELEFDVMDFIRDAPTRSLTLPGSTVLSVAVGFEIWSGPITKLESQDFYVAVQ